MFLIEGEKPIFFQNLLNDALLSSKSLGKYNIWAWSYKWLYWHGFTFLKETFHLLHCTLWIGWEGLCGHRVFFGKNCKLLQKSSYCARKCLDNKLSILLAIHLNEIVLQRWSCSVKVSIMQKLVHLHREAWSEMYQKLKFGT